MKRQMAFVFVFYLLIIHQATLTDADALVLLKKSIVDPDDALSSWSTCSPHPPATGLEIICVSGISIGIDIITGLHLANLGLFDNINVDAHAHFKGLRSISLNNNNFVEPLPKKRIELGQYGMELIGNKNGANRKIEMTDKRQENENKAKKREVDNKRKNQKRKRSQSY
ncbi:pollen receptor-like kinase 3 [Canna indica]|uniref:Pollen receptor-like kinase 3 n=1 Tax=Canna indica TaxID=4628 RepID=A0AAQ3JXN8_9LILI|nr:pollen receptor-like kinase 3 [Canna indica]